MIGIDLDSLIVVLKHYVKEYGSQKAFAKKLGVSTQYLNDVIHKRREPGNKILKPLKFARNILYIFTE